MRCQRFGALMYTAPVLNRVSGLVHSKQSQHTCSPALVVCGTSFVCACRSAEMRLQALLATLMNFNTLLKAINAVVQVFVRSLL